MHLLSVVPASFLLYVPAVVARLALGRDGVDGTGVE
jgi:hypothetical protein